jgi:Fe2+ or Zn2+ uptake regulation protein
MKLNEHLHGSEGSPAQDITHDLPTDPQGGLPNDAALEGMASRADSSQGHSGGHSHEHAYDSLIAGSGIRLTPQRRYVFEALMEKRDHPTALEVFMRVKERMPSISLATVYNCLEALTESHLIRHVNLDRESSRYCANLAPHGHFFCAECGAILDVPLNAVLETAWVLPEKTVVTQSEVTLRGFCADCAPAGSSDEGVR